MKKRQRIKHTATFDERLAERAKHLKDQARAMPAGQTRDDLLRRARQMETASHINEWLCSPGLSSPR
jgi:hypothetical protein